MSIFYIFPSCKTLFASIGFMSLCFTSVVSLHRMTHQKPDYTPIKYVIFHNETVMLSKGSQRNICILMRESDFSEKNLRRLQEIINLKYSDQGWFLVAVYTNLDQIDSPNCSAASESRRGSSVEKYPFAVLIKDGENELFRYRLPSENAFKTVIIKGSDALNR
jgi:hypothetical protein